MGSFSQRERVTTSRTTNPTNAKNKHNPFGQTRLPRQLQLQVQDTIDPAVGVGGGKTSRFRKAPYTRIEAPSAPRRTAPHRTAPHRAAPHRTAPHRTAPHRTAPHRTTPHHTAPHRTAPHRHGTQQAPSGITPSSTSPRYSLLRRRQNKPRAREKERESRPKASGMWANLDGGDERLQQLRLSELAEEPQSAPSHVLVRVVQVVPQGVAHLSLIHI